MTNLAGIPLPNGALFPQDNPYDDALAWIRKHNRNDAPAISDVTNFSWQTLLAGLSLECGHAEDPARVMIDCLRDNKFNPMDDLVVQSLSLKIPLIGFSHAILALRNWMAES